MKKDNAHLTMALNLHDTVPKPNGFVPKPNGIQNLMILTSVFDNAS